MRAFMPFLIVLLLVCLVVAILGLAVRAAAQRAVYNEPFPRPSRLSAKSGWLGDPDGMIRYGGIYHVFWWGHAISDDLVHWKEQPYPMIGDDGSFVYFSGSVVVDKDNTAGFRLHDETPMIAVYTMHDKTTGEE